MDKLVTGAVTYRDKDGGVEWYVVKSRLREDRWELPKSDVKRGESSVQAIIRHTQENLGVKATVMDEAGRLNVTTTYQGAPVEEKVIFYLMRNVRGDIVDRTNMTTEVNTYGEWLKYASAKRRLSLVREQRMLAQAQGIVKEWRQKKPRKS